MQICAFLQFLVNKVNAFIYKGLKARYHLFDVAQFHSINDISLCLCHRLTNVTVGVAFILL